MIKLTWDALLVKVAGLAKCVVKPLNDLKDSAKKTYHVSLKQGVLPKIW